MRDRSTGGVSGRGLSNRLGALRAAGLSGAAAAALLVAAAPAPAHAQMMGFGGMDGGGFGGEQMAGQMAPMLEMMKQRMGKKRYAQLMQTFGPMMANMMDGGGGGGGFGGGGFSSAGFGGMGGMGGMDMGAMMGMVSAMDWRSMQGLMGGSPRKGRRSRR